MGVFTRRGPYAKQRRSQDRIRGLLFFETSRLGIRGYLKPVSMIKQGLELYMWYVRAPFLLSFFCRHWIAMTPGVYLPPLPPELRLASILVIRPRCVPDPPG